MSKKLRTIKTIVIFALLCSSLLLVVSTAKSLPIDQIYECTPTCIIEYNQTILQDPIIPYDAPRIIPINVKTKVNGPAEDIVVGKLGPDGIEYELIVYLSIDNIPEGCRASINPPLLKFLVTSDYSSNNASISITVNRDLPADAEKKIVVRMVTKRIGNQATLVKAGNFTQEIPFTIGYLPQLSFTYPDGNVRDISPEETAEFTIELQNWGNGVTKVLSEAVDVPEGWLFEIVENTTLGTYQLGTNNKKTISLNIKPPASLGYHEDRAIIKVKMTPLYFENEEIKGESHYLYFIVQSKGFSASAAPGFEFIGIAFALFFVLLIGIGIRKINNKQKKKGEE